MARPPAAAAGSAGSDRGTYPPGDAGLAELREQVRSLRLQSSAISRVRRAASADVYETAKAAEAVAEQKKLKKIHSALIGSLIAAAVLYVLQRVISIYFRYKFMIRELDANKPSQWPASGFATAAVVDIPALAGWVGFKSPSLAIAAYFCYTTPDLLKPFMKNQRGYLQKMFEVAIKGDKSPDAPPNYNALTIICKAWANPQGVDRCVVPCPQPSLNWANVATSALNGGIGLGFSGHILAAGVAPLSAAAGPIALATGVVGAGLSGLASYMSAKRQEVYNGLVTNEEKCKT